MWRSLKNGISNPKFVSFLVSVHEYGGGSFIVVNDAPYYITVNGIFKQVAADSEPELIVAADHSHRFADLCYHKVIYVIL